MKEVIGSLVRNILQAAGGGLIAKGVIDSTEIDIIAGAIVGIATVAWSVIQKYRSKGKTVKAIEVAAETGSIAQATKVVK